MKKYKWLNIILTIQCIILFQLFVKANDSTELLPLGHYLLSRPCIVQGEVKKVGILKAKIEVKYYLKGGLTKKNIQAFHATSIKDRNNSRNDLDSIKNESCIFIMSGKNGKTKTLRIKDRIRFQIINDSLHISKEYFGYIRNLDSSHQELAKRLRKEGIKVSVDYFKYLVELVNVMYIRVEGERCYKYYDINTELDEFTLLVLNDLKSEICE